MTATIDSRDDVRTNARTVAVEAPDTTEAVDTAKPVSFAPQTPEAYELLGTDPVLPIEERVIQAISRAAGPVALIVAAAGLVYLFV